MTRIALLGAAALTCVPTLALCQSHINGGGTGNVVPTIPVEFSKFNPGSLDRAPVTPGKMPRTATFTPYFEVESNVAQTAFLTDDLGVDGGQSGGPVHYAASDITFDADQIAFWATSGVGQAVAGNLIQLPSMGAGVAIPVVNAAIKKNGALTLSDNDLCGVFSGAITDFGQIKDSKTKPTAGTILVAYASDAAGTTFWLTNHLSAVCNGGNAAITFAATTTFASLFPGGRPPNNFVGAQDGQEVASLLAGCFGAVTSALGYVVPAYTRVDPKSGAVLDPEYCGSNVPSPLLAAALTGSGKPTLPTYANIATGLTHAATGSNLTPPSNPTQGADPTAWVPLVQTVTSGYPIVGYTTWDFAQCYMGYTMGASPVGFALDAFLRLHYGIGTEKHSATYPKLEHAGGFATLKDTSANGFLAAITANILANTNGWNTDIDNATMCPNLPGR